MLPVELKLQVVSSNHLSHLLNSYAFGFLWNSCAAIMEEDNSIIIEKLQFSLFTTTTTKHFYRGLQFDLVR